jgi:hypothetical protein
VSASEPTTVWTMRPSSRSSGVSSSTLPRDFATNLDGWLYTSIPRPGDLVKVELSAQFVVVSEGGHGNGGVVAPTPRGQRGEVQKTVAPDFRASRGRCKMSWWMTSTHLDHLSASDGGPYFEKRWLLTLDHTPPLDASPVMPLVAAVPAARINPSSMPLSSGRLVTTEPPQGVCDAAMPCVVRRVSFSSSWGARRVAAIEWRQETSINQAEPALTPRNGLRSRGVVALLLRSAS